MRSGWMGGALCALVLTSCSGGTTISSGGDGGVFQFASTDEIDLDVHVVKNGTDVQGAVVSVVEVWAGDLSAQDSAAQANGEEFFRGGSGADGRCTAEFTLPTRYTQVDVIVHHPGSTGDYTNEALRTTWGPFAPSARMTVARENLTDLIVTLEDR